jgi:hypothetical protein
MCPFSDDIDIAGHLGQSITANGKERTRISREPREPRKYYFGYQPSTSIPSDELTQRFGTTKIFGNGFFIFVRLESLGMLRFTVSMRGKKPWRSSMKRRSIFQASKHWNHLGPYRRPRLNAATDSYHVVLGTALLSERHAPVPNVGLPIWKSASRSSACHQQVWKPALQCFGRVHQFSHEISKLEPLHAGLELQRRAARG